MAKVALLIGVGTYTSGLAPLPAAPRDVEAMKDVLQHPEMGNFDRVKTLIDPNHWQMAEAIETQFRACQSDDLVLLYFSGHGVKDENRTLYFAACNTRKEREELITSTAVAATFVRDRIKRSKSKRQVVILDCCFSGAFGDLIARDDGSVDLEDQLGAEGQVVLTSSSSLQYSFEQKEAELSIYTRHLVEGVRTGVADSDADGIVSVDELHEYASKKVQETVPAMNPKIIVLKDEGFRIQLARAPLGDPKLKYRREAERRVKGSEFSIPARRLLDSLRDELSLSPEDTAAIEAEVLQPYRQYECNLQVYKQTLLEAMRMENRLSEPTLRDLRDYQERLGLRDEDIAHIVNEMMPPREALDRWLAPRGALDRWIQSQMVPGNTPQPPTALSLKELHQLLRYLPQEELSTSSARRSLPHSSYSPPDLPQEELSTSSARLRPQIGWKFWFSWVLATAGSAFLGAAIFTSTDSSSYVSQSDTAPIAVAAIALVGLAQWFILRRQVSRTRWWILATTLGMFVGLITIGILPIIAALVERFGYKRQISKSVWWALIATLSGYLSLLSMHSMILEHDLGSVVVAGAIYGAITGKGIIWLLQRSTVEAQV